VLEQQWMSIYRETIHPLYGYTARRTGGNRELTEDVVQETYLRALDDWAHKSPPDCPLAWLKRVARNVLIDYLRQRKWDSRTAVEEEAGPVPQRPGGELASLEMVLAMASLGRMKARVLEAFYYDGMSTREIAGELSMSERAVEGHLRRARRSLRSLLPGPGANGGKHE
jgi:RNA polymerase sigma-70 factor, ECF subfamily